jgi:hypothetical protein
MTNETDKPEIVSENIGNDVLEGADEIAGFLGKTVRQVNHLLETRQLPGAFKMGHKWHLRPSTFRERIRQLESAA